MESTPTFLRSWFLEAGRPVLQRREAAREGIDPSQLTRWVRAGHLTRVGNGGYVLACARTAKDEAWAIHHEQYLLDAKAIAGTLRNVHLARESAALLHGLPLLAQPKRVVVARTPMVRTRRPQIWSVPAWGTPPILLGDTPVQAMSECAVEIAAQWGLESGLVTTDAALRSGCSARDLSASVESFGSRPGSGIARRLLDFADARHESPAETRLALVLRRAELDFEPQWKVWDETGRLVARADFKIRHQRLIIEMDGLLKYATAQDLRAEKLRELTLQRLGFNVLRFGYADLKHPERIVTRVRATMK